jgi:glycosyltransferase involved in cell wall biosynthesis
VGDEKMKLLKQAHYFVLPSHSEGLPTGVLEAMSHGLIPVLSEGCNLPEVFTLHLGHKVETNEDSIARVLTTLRDVPYDDNLSVRNFEFISENYSENKTGERLLQVYSKMIAPK